jgi:hypothetical protein
VGKPSTPDLSAVSAWARGTRRQLMVETTRAERMPMLGFERLWFRNRGFVAPVRYLSEASVAASIGVCAAPAIPGVIGLSTFGRACAGCSAFPARTLSPKCSSRGTLRAASLLRIKHIYLLHIHLSDAN